MESENKPQFMKMFWGTLLLLVLVVVLVWFVVKIGTIITYFAVGGAIAYILNPAVEAMGRRRIPRGIAILIMFLVFIGVIALGLGLIIPPVIREFNALVENLPRYFETVKGLWDGVIGMAKETQLPIELEKLPEQLAADLQSFVKNAGISISSGLAGFFSGIAALVIIPIITFYFLQDGAKMKEHFLSLVPSPYRDETKEIIAKINKALGGFVRGQLKLCLAMGVLTWLSLALVAKLEYAVVFGAIAGVTEFIPYLGPILALIGPLIFATTLGWGKVVTVLVLFVVIQFLEGNVLAPRIIGKDVDMHPATILLVLMAGGQVGGIAGMIAAIPAAVIIKVLFDHFYVQKVVKVMDEKEKDAGEEPTEEPQG
ncbi:AI-2E family transporter [bacterium]